MKKVMKNTTTIKTTYNLYAINLVYITYNPVYETLRDQLRRVVSKNTTIKRSCSLEYCSDRLPARIEQLSGEGKRDVEEISTHLCVIERSDI